MKYTAFNQVVKTATKPSFLILTLTFMLLYIILQAYILNHNLINQTISGSSSLLYKITLFYYVTSGYLQMLPTTYLGVTLAITFFVGVNLSLAVANYQKARQMGRMKLSFGGSSLLAVVSSGCPSCGLTALSLLGPSTGAFSFLIHDIRLQFVIVGILFFSLIYNVRTHIQAPVCEVPKR